jgi:thiamine-monophosphate kinase
VLPSLESTLNFSRRARAVGFILRIAFIIRQAEISSAASYKRLPMLITTGQKDREAQLIDRLVQKIPSIGHAGSHAGVRLGIGDDATVLRPSVKSEWVLSCDFTLEDVHFRDATHPPASIGYRCLARATSDVAAMGGRPRYFLLALALPASKTGKWLDLFASGMSRAALEFNMRLIGGDISRTASVAISITVLGETPAGVATPRSGAKPGHLIYLTGTLGAAQLGLEILLRGLAGKPSLKKFLQPHLYPRIPIAFAQILARRRIPSAMMDISDGLSTDLARLCASSAVGARIWSDKLPNIRIPAGLTGQNLDPLRLALHGGEDYGLLFTIPPKSAPLLRSIAAKRTRVTHIGEITRTRKILLVHPNGRESPLPSKGWDPFR